MILTARWIVPVTHPPIENGFVEIRADRIVAVGRHGRAPASPAVAERGADFGEAVITPGLVNPHAHLELSCYAGQLPPAPLWDWIAGLVELRRRPDAALRERAALEGFAWRSLRAGVTCIGDISRRGDAWEVLKGVPIRKVCFAELLSVADEPPRNLAELRAAIESVEEDDLLTAGVSPHAPYTVPADQFAEAIRLADELNRPWTTHLAETREEAAFLRGDASQMPAMLARRMRRRRVESPACSPGDFIERIAAGGSRGCLAHLNYAELEDFRTVARGGHAVVFCPRAHRYYGHDRYPLEDALAAGVRLAIGTDSPASDANVSPLEELQCLRGRFGDAPPPHAMLRMVTIDAAAALRLDGRIGSIEPGKQADLVAFPLAANGVDPIAALLEQRPAPSAVWVNGQLVVRHDGADDGGKCGRCAQ